MNKDDVKRWIEGWEGRRHHVYDDSAGHPTIGVGFNLDRADARLKIAALRLDYNLVRSGGIDLSNDQINQLFDTDVDQAVADAKNLVANFDAIPESKQKVVVDMIFNLGAKGFAGFRKLIKAIEQGDWQAAAREMENSRWYRQVGNRAVANVEVMSGRRKAVTRKATARGPKRARAMAPGLRGLIDPQKGESIIRVAEQVAQDYRERGVQYREGGDASAGGHYSDCSHFVHDVLTQAGYRIPYITTSGMAKSDYFSEIQLSVAKAGDVIVQGHHMGVFQGTYIGGCPIGTQMGITGPKDGKWGPGGWFDDPDDMRFYRLNT